MTARINQRILGAALVALSLVAMGFSAATTIKANREAAGRNQYAHCQAGIDDRLVRALKARSDSSAARTDATDNLIDSIFQAKTREEGLALFREWKAAREKAIADRKANPLPDPPSNTCHF